jgi:hypothetical protein
MAQDQQPQESMPMLKVSVLHYRDQSRDEETWTKWYLEEQIPRYVPIAQKHGIDRVELVSCPNFFPSHIMSQPICASTICFNP